MKIYIIEQRQGPDSLVPYEVLPYAYCSAEAAKHVVEKRTGSQPIHWQKHDAPGLVWTAHEEGYYVTELELRNDAE